MLRNMSVSISVLCLLNHAAIPEGWLGTCLGNAKFTSTHSCPLAISSEFVTSLTSGLDIPHWRMWNLAYHEAMKVPHHPTWKQGGIHSQFSKHWLLGNKRWEWVAQRNPFCFLSSHEWFQSIVSPHKPHNIVSPYLEKFYMVRGPISQLLCFVEVASTITGCGIALHSSLPHFRFPSV